MKDIPRFLRNARCWSKVRNSIYRSIRAHLNYSRLGISHSKWDFLGILSQFALRTHSASFCFQQNLSLFNTSSLAQTSCISNDFGSKQAAFEFVNKQFVLCNLAQLLKAIHAKSNSVDVNNVRLPFLTCQLTSLTLGAGFSISIQIWKLCSSEFRHLCEWVIVTLLAKFRLTDTNARECSRCWKGKTMQMDHTWKSSDRFKPSLPFKWEANGARGSNVMTRKQ